MSRNLKSTGESEQQIHKKHLQCEVENITEKECFKVQTLLFYLLPLLVSPLTFPSLLLCQRILDFQLCVENVFLLYVTLNNG